MLEGIISFFKKFGKGEASDAKSKDMAKERLHLVLMQDRANVSADFLEMMKQEIIDVIKKYITVDENEIDVRLTNKTNEDGTSGAPALYANIPIVNIKNENKKIENKLDNSDSKETSKENKQVEKIKDDENKEVIKEKVSSKNENVKETKEDIKKSKVDEKEAKKENIQKENKEENKIKESKENSSNEIQENAEKVEKAENKKNVASEKKATKKVSKKTTIAKNA